MMSSESSSSSTGMIFMDGSRITSLLAILRSNESSKDGSSNKFDNIANNKVADTKAPKATVPPKLEVVNTINPKNNTIEV